MKTLNQKLTALSPARRKKIATRAAVLIAEEMSLQELRQAHKLTQAARRKEAGHWSGGDLRAREAYRPVDLDAARLRGDHGGRLSIVAEFPDHEPVIVSGLAALDFGSGGQSRRV